MKKNVNDYERIGRVIGGLIMSSMAFWGPRNKWMLLNLGLVYSGLTGKCQLYSALGVNTRKDVEDEANRYFPVQSNSEMAAGHPIVGVS